MGLTTVTKIFYIIVKKISPTSSEERVVGSFRTRGKGYPGILPCEGPLKLSKKRGKGPRDSDHTDNSPRVGTRDTGSPNPTLGSRGTLSRFPLPNVSQTPPRPRTLVLLSCPRTCIGNPTWVLGSNLRSQSCSTGTSFLTEGRRNQPSLVDQLQERENKKELSGYSESRFRYTVNKGGPGLETSLSP